MNLKRIASEIANYRFRKRAPSEEETARRNAAAEDVREQFLQFVWAVEELGTDDLSVYLSKKPQRRMNDDEPERHQAG